MTMKLVALAILLFIFLQATLISQSVTNPTRATFVASASHETLVDRYELRFYYPTATQPFQVVALGKPTPNAARVITVDLAAIFAGFPVGKAYVARVVAIAATGEAASAPSNPFNITKKRPPWYRRLWSRLFCAWHQGADLAALPACPGLDCGTFLCPPHTWRAPLTCLTPSDLLLHA